LQQAAHLRQQVVERWPLVLATVLSRRLRDLVAVTGAALGVVLISGALTVPWDELAPYLSAQGRIGLTRLRGG